MKHNSSIIYLLIEVQRRSLPAEQEFLSILPLKLLLLSFQTTTWYICRDKSREIFYTSFQMEELWSA